MYAYFRVPILLFGIRLSKAKNYYLAKFIANVNLIYRVNFLGLHIKNLMLSLILEFVKYYADQIKLRLYWNFRLYWIRLYWNFQSIVSNTFSAGTRIFLRLYWNFAYIRIRLYWNSTVIRV